MRSAVVCMTHCPFFLRDWVQYHIKLGFDRIYLRLEGPNLEEYLMEFKNHPIIRILEYQYYPMGNQETRQGFLVNQAIEECKKERIDFLLHVDDDELFHVNNNKSLQDFLHSLEKYSVDYFHFKNVEALYTKSADQPKTRSCFSRSKTFARCYDGDFCRGYGNGKSMAFISNSPSIKSFGVHFFTGNSKEIDPDQAVILHYESCDYEDWKKKFSNINKGTHEFPFYSQSMKALETYETCLNVEDHSRCEEVLWQFYDNQTSLNDQKQIWNLP